ncbi:MAG: hypothetical protein JJT89_02550 [Nitriliruptoraceae bacterium]|nr:hypothetical protein [Nitriliruptoraceae bacterium]
MTTIAIGPPALGLTLTADATVSADGWLVRELTAAPGLDGPPGILQGGFSAGVGAAVAAVADPFGAPLTSLEMRLHAPTPLGRTLQARVRSSEVPARYEVETRDGDTLLVSGEVELAGHEPAARAYDLAELARVAIPDAEPQDRFPSCWVCGPEPTHPHGQRLHPRHVGPDAVSIPWVADEELGGERSVVDPLVVAAVLDCPGVWASIAHVEAQGHVGCLLAGYRLTMFRDAPVMEPLRTVARMDEGDGRKIRARSALVDEDGVTYAVAAALHISVPEMPAAP